jgi:hypothetical protein
MVGGKCDGIYLIFSVYISCKIFTARLVHFHHETYLVDKEGTSFHGLQDLSTEIEQTMIHKLLESLPAANGMIGNHLPLVFDPNKLFSRKFFLP